MGANAPKEGPNELGFQLVSSDCSGQCGALIRYKVVTEHGSAPEFYPVNASYAFAGGHLCHECAHVVFAALKSRRKK